MQQIAILYDASQAILSTFQLDEVLDQILTIVRDYFHLEGGSILLLDQERKVLKVRLSFGKQPAEVEIPLEKGLTGAAARAKRPIYSADVTKDRRYLNIVSSTRSEVAIPLMVRDQVVGVLDCQSDQVDFFDSETVDLLTLFATQASIALVNAEIYSREQKRAQQMEAIGAIARQSTAVLKTEELLVELCMSIVKYLRLDAVAVLTSEPDGSLILRASDGPLQPAIQASQTLLPLRNAAANALDERTPHTIRDQGVGSHLLYPEAHTELVLPLVSANNPLGVLVFAATLATAFPEEDIATLESVADICATSIQNAHYFSHMEQLANVDGLTGVFNRRQFERRIGEELERAARYGSGLSIIMIDLDHFKRVNDEFGHLLGDEVLRGVSQIFHQGLRKPDVCCRYGGEEFAIILPETSGQNAVRVAEKLRNLVAEHDFPGVPRRITISAGVADFPRCGTTRDDIVRAADDSLYLAKQAGRNCVASPDSLDISNLMT
jgi:diguanylate cyclase (GGDEF)-like protein